jgi:GNAT superfamily N-acetyltransferase
MGDGMTSSLDQEIAIQLLKTGEEDEVIELVRLVFNQFEAPDYLPSGVKEFYEYAESQAMRDRRQNHFVLTAKKGGKIVGMIEMRNYSHIALLFVHPDWQHKGIARNLFETALVVCADHYHYPPEVTVNSSPYAEGFYKTIGFIPAGNLQEVNGLRFIPMKMHTNPMQTRPLSIQE